jgi:hypothetical protein
MYGRIYLRKFWQSVELVEQSGAWNAITSSLAKVGETTQVRVDSNSSVISSDFIYSLFLRLGRDWGATNPFAANDAMSGRSMPRRPEAALDP